MSKKIFLKCFAVSLFSAAILFVMAVFPSCKSTAQAVDEASIAVPQEPVITYVNTTVNKADGKISTILVFNSIKEVTAIHPISRVRYPLGINDYKYDSASTELKVFLPKNVPFKINELAFHIVGEAVFPGVFVLAGIDQKRGDPGVFFEGTKSVEGTDYTYDKASARLTSLIPLNVDKDSFEICWATINGEVTFSNNTQKYRDAYIKYYNDWSRSIHMRGNN
ncbi:MAG: hypothetical protein J6V90_07260 [Treponema sp.]|nr:hypothetical protein [Treponema sp.]